MTKIDFLMQVLANNDGSMSFFDNCALCPLREACRADSEGTDDLHLKTCDEFLDGILED